MEGLLFALKRVAKNPNKIGDKVEAIVATKEYAPTTFPEFSLDTEFCIMVIAGEKYDPEKNIVRAQQNILA
jgi:hypothetical protein